MLSDHDALTAARAVVTSALGRDPGPLNRAASKSHHVFIGTHVVVKLIEVAEHDRLDREIAIGLDLPAGLSASLLANGVLATEVGEVRYACLARLPGVTPGRGLPGVDRATALRWAGEALEQLQRLHGWTPNDVTAGILRQPLDHGGFVGRSALGQRIKAVSPFEVVPRRVLDGLTGIAENAPEQAEVDVPVHADCYWDNWLVNDGRVTALLDFEWARFGEAADDWMFLARFSGPHWPAVLALIATETGTELDALRSACEVREASQVLADLVPALRVIDTNPRARPVVQNLIGELQHLVIDRSWWRSDR